MIIVMDNGRISELGSYTELTNHKGPFVEFLDNHMINVIRNPQSASTEPRFDTRNDVCDKKNSTGDKKDESDSDGGADNSENDKKVHFLFNVVSLN